MKSNTVLIAAVLILLSSTGSAATRQNCLDIVTELVNIKNFSEPDVISILNYTKGDLTTKLKKLSPLERFKTILSINMASQSTQFKYAIGDVSYDTIKIKDQYKSYFPQGSISSKSSAVPGFTAKIAENLLVETYWQASKSTRKTILEFLESGINHEKSWQTVDAFPQTGLFKREEFLDAAEDLLEKLFQDNSVLIQQQRAATQSRTLLQSALGSAAYSYSNNQTPYIGFLNILRSLPIKSGQTVVDIGCAYGRLGLVGGDLLPDVKFIGYDLAVEPVAEANRLAKKFGYKNSKYYVQDLSHPSFHLPEADYYYFWLPVNAETAPLILNQLQNIARKKEIRLVSFMGLSSEGEFKNNHLAKLGWLREEEHKKLTVPPGLRVFVSTLH